jgi:hypothetical protein
MRRIYLLLLLTLVLNLVGCSRKASIASGETALPAANQQPVAVARAQADRDDPPADLEGFRFPDDKAGTLLAKVLPPMVDRQALVDRAPTPRRSPPASLELPALPLTPAVAPLPRVDLEPRKAELRPRLVVDEKLAPGFDVVLPQAQSLPTSERLRQVGIDVNMPPALPVLAVPFPDRASLDDPTVEASAAAALAAVIPERTTPVPFGRISVPDPFENHAPVRLAGSPAEPAVPPVGPPRTPNQP